MYYYNENSCEYPVKTHASHLRKRLSAPSHQILDMISCFLQRYYQSAHPPFRLMLDTLTRIGGYLHIYIDAKLCKIIHKFIIHSATVPSVRKSSTRYISIDHIVWLLLDRAHLTNTPSTPKHQSLYGTFFKVSNN